MEWIQGAIAWVTGHIDVLLQVVGAFAALATLTPNKSDDKIVQAALDGINFLGANLGKAKNPKE